VVSAPAVLVFRIISYWMPALGGVLASVSTLRARRPLAREPGAHDDPRLDQGQLERVDAPMTDAG